MRTITKEVFQFDELTDDAKEKAREWFREGNDYSWSGEFRESLDGFCNMVGVTLRDWEYDQWSYDFTLPSAQFGDEGGLTGLRLFRYCQNRFDRFLTKPKKYGKRVSRITREQDDCPFTGVCFDEDFLDPLRALLKTGRFNGDYSDLVRECLYSGFKAVVSDIEYQNSDEAVDEAIICNDYEFYANGERV